MKIRVWLIGQGSKTVVDVKGETLEECLDLAKKEVAEKHFGGKIPEAEWEVAEWAYS